MMLSLISGLQLTLYDYSMMVDFMEFNVSMAEISFVTMLTLAAWLVKFLPGVLSDLYSVNGLKRKPYMIIANMAVAIFAILVSQNFEKVPGYVLCLFFYNIFLCFADVNYDACVVEETKDEDDQSKGWLQVRVWMSRDLGCLLGGFFGSVGWKYLGSENIYLIIACISFCAAMLGVLYKEKNTAKWSAIDDNKSEDPALMHLDCLETFKYKMSLVFESMSHPVYFRLLIFIYVIQLFPTLSLPMFYYLIGPMGYTPQTMANLSLIAGLGRFVGVFIFTLLKHKPYSVIYILAGLLSLIGSCLPLFNIIRFSEEQARSYLHINNTYLYQNLTENATLPLSELIGLDSFGFAAVEGFIGEVVNQLRYMPLITLTSLLCKNTIEATFPAFVFSSINIIACLRKAVNGGILQELNITYQDFSSFYILSCICIGFDMLSFIITLCVVPNVTVQFISGETKENKQPGEIELEPIEFKTNEKPFYTNKDIPEY